MKLRPRLLLAFLAVSVVPLAVITGLSYRSSLAAFREAIEEEGRATALEMSRRMSTVAADVSRRVERIGQSGAFEAAEEADGLGQQAILEELERELGAAATLLERVEVVPRAAETTAEGDEEGAVPPAVVIDLQKVLENVKGFVPEVAIDGSAVLFDSIDSMPAEARLAWAEALRREGARLGREQERLRGETARAVAQAEAARRPREAASPTPPSAPGAPRPPRAAAPRADLRARLSMPRLLGTVLGMTRREAGEIPFAFGTDGRVLTPDPDDERLLRALDVGEGLPPGGSVEVTAGGETWVVVADRDAASGVTFGIVRPVGESLRAMRRSVIRNLGIGALVTALATGLVFPLSRRMTRPVVLLTDGVQRMAEGDLSVRVDVRAGGEIGELARAVNRMAGDLQRQQIQAVEQERIRRELEVCRQIQFQMLPKTPLRRGLVEVKGVSIPAQEVGGDFFNYFVLPEGELAVLVGDVSGKGVGAALLMANAQATLRALLPLEPDLSQLVADIDREVEANTPPEVFLTLFAAVLDADGRTLRWVNAGHNPPFVLRATGGLEQLEATGMPLGLVPGSRHAERTTFVGPGDLLFFYTDGIVEARDPSGEIFGTEKLEQLLAEMLQDGIDAALARVEEAVHTFRQGAEPSDDATMVVLRVDVASS